VLLVGSLEPGTAYIEELQKAAAQNTNVVLTGFQTGEALAQMYGHAGVFVLPSSHEGLPIALLEALSYGRQVLASDIPANLEVELVSTQFFVLGDVVALAEKLVDAAAKGWSDADANKARAITLPYDWDLIADHTYAVYRRSLPGLGGQLQSNR
jgi:glycosyltransferase involved in cell wall biosynthesis